MMAGLEGLFNIEQNPKKNAPTRKPGAISKGGYILMKKGMMIFAAIALVTALLSPVYAGDTTVTGLSTTAVDAGPDIAVSRTGKTYVSARVSATQFQVVSDGAGTFSNVIAATVPVNGTPRFTAVACYGPSDSPVVAVAGDTSIEIYIQDTGTASLRSIGRVSSKGTGGNVAGASTSVDSITIQAMDLLANDSWVMVVAAVGDSVLGQSALACGDSNIMVWLFRVQACNAATLDSQYDTLYLARGVRSADLTAQHSVARGLSRNSDTAFVFYVAANIQSDTLAGPGRGGDSGIFISRVAMTANPTSLLVFVDSVMISGQGISKDDTFADFDLEVEQVSGSDTNDRLTLIILPSLPVLADTIVVVELDVDSQLVLGSGRTAVVAGGAGLVVSDTYLNVDTGLATYGTYNSSRLQSVVFGRSGGSIKALFLSSNGAMHGATTGFARSVRGGVTSSASASWSVDTYGVNTGYVENSFKPGRSIGIDTFVNNFLELQKTKVNGTLYVVGHNKTTGAIWYTTLSWGDSGKKKDSGVCLMDRMFGHTSLRAAFPALKSFRDTLLGTDMGRKLVSLYYSF